MRRTLRVFEIILFWVMLVSVVILASRLNFGSSNDKEPIYWIFLFVVLAYVLVSFFFMWKSFKTNETKYRNISIVLGLIYVVFLIFLYS